MSDVQVKPEDIFNVHVCGVFSNSVHNKTSAQVDDHLPPCEEQNLDQLCNLMD